MEDTCVTNELGDVAFRDDGESLTPVDPSAWGWVQEGGKKDRAETRLSVDMLRALPGLWSARVWARDTSPVP